MMPRELQLPISTTSSTRTTNILNPSANPNPSHRHHHHYQFQESNPALGPPAPRPPQKKKRNLPGTPDPDADVIAMSPRALMATNKFLCEICGKGFQRDQNLQLHRRGHNLPWKLKQRSTKEMKKKVYVCPEKTCVHHDPCRALGDLTGIKKHFSRKHGEKKWKCDKCSKKYAVMSDWKAHSKTCGTREYKCDCGTIFSRKDSFVTHRAFCDALTEENMRLSSTITTAISAGAGINGNHNQVNQHMCLSNMYAHDQKSADLSLWLNRQVGVPDVSALFNPISIPGRTTGVELLPTGSSHGYASEMLDIKDSNLAPSIYSSGNNHSSSGGSLTHMSATALLQKAAQMGAGVSNSSSSMFAGIGAVMAGSVDKTVNNENSSTRTGGNMGMRIGEMPMGWNIDGVGGSLTRDFLGLGGDDQNPSCRPLFSPQELAKIASMGNDMELITSPYNGNRR